MTLRGTTLLAVVTVLGCGGGTPAAPRVLEDAQVLAFVDDNGDGLSYDDEPRLIKFSDYFAANRPGTKVLMPNAAAGWCAPCMQEASKLAAFAETYVPRGVAVLTAVFQKPDATGADLEFTRSWAQTFQLPIPTIADTLFETKRYFDVNALPANLFVDSKTGEILTVATGASPGDDPLKEYRDLLDHYLASR